MAMGGKTMQILRKTNLKALKKARSLGQEGTISLIEKKGLVGRGGAGHPTADKWRTARNTRSDERFVVCNADEGEPGTFKDRLILSKNPDTVVEGILIAAYAIGAKRCFIYLRGEYECLRERVQKSVDSVLKRSGEGVSIEIVRGAGAYVC